MSKEASEAAWKNIDSIFDKLEAKGISSTEICDIISAVVKIEDAAKDQGYINAISENRSIGSATTADLIPKSIKVTEVSTTSQQISRGDYYK